MKSGFREKLLDGRRALAHLIHVWHERNGWSHKVLPALAECLSLGTVHSSQISNLRNGKLASPGPEVFLALAQANALLHKGIEPFKEHLAKLHPALLKVLLESAVPLLDDEGQPISAGLFFEIFLGMKPLPSCFDWFIEESEAIDLSAGLADYFCNGRSWRNCREKVMRAYPVKNEIRRDRFAAVMAGLRDYTAEELDGELLDLHATAATLNVGEFANGTNIFLEDLRSRSSKLKVEKT